MKQRAAGGHVALWSGTPAGRPSHGGAAPQVVDIDALWAKTATLAARDAYAGAYAVYPAWGKTACLVLGVAIPARDDDARARAVRDRFAKEVLPRVEVLTTEEPKERF